MRIPTFIIIFLCLPFSAMALDFDFYQKNGPQSGPTLLVVGGVDGDEPGGFHSAAALITHYQLHKGNLWIVPNLSFQSILERKRGEMNLKFAEISPQDPLFDQVERIKQIITRPQVDLVLNLHDGSGYYHPTRIDSKRNPQRWGQCFVIDQSRVAGKPFGNLKGMAEKAISQVNSKTLQRDHHFQLKNALTRTVEEDIPAKKSLTFYAVRNNKPAIAIEASKQHPVHIRTYYHLLALETFMRASGIDFSRDFQLTPEGVARIIDEDARLSLADGRIQLELNDMRETIRNLPLPKDSAIGFTTVNPLVTLQTTDRRQRIHYGNNRLAFIEPDYVELDQSIDAVRMSIDGIEQKIPFGSIVPVSKNFLVDCHNGYRVNVIGYAREGKSDDGRQKIGLGELQKDYSIDRSGRIYRVEVYKKDRFSGMILVDFRPQGTLQEPLMAQGSTTLKKDDVQNN